MIQLLFLLWRHRRQKQPLKPRPKNGKVPGIPHLHSWQLVSENEAKKLKCFKSVINLTQRTAMHDD